MPDERTITPLILGFDTSGPHCAAGLLRRDGTVATRFEEMARGQAERIVPLLQELLADEGLDWTDLDALAVSVGPGNFTGIRISVSAVRGLALALKIPALSVSNFEILLGIEGLSKTESTLASLPAPRSTHYVQLFENAHSSGTARTFDGTPNDFVVPSDTTIIGSNATEISKAIASTTQAIERAIMPANVPETLVQIASQKWASGFDPAIRPAPLYVKPPDAAPPRDLPPRIIA